MRSALKYFLGYSEFHNLIALVWFEKMRFFFLDRNPIAHYCIYYMHVAITVNYRGDSVNLPAYGGV